MNTSITTKRDVRLDFLRVLAIIECIWAHAMMAEPLTKTEYLWYVMFLPDTAAVFFMASGALILTRQRPAGWKYVWHRIASFLPEFILFSLLYLFLNRHFGYSPETRTVTTEIMYLFVTPTWGPGWFILALIGLYLVTPLLHTWVQHATRRQIEVGIVLWLGATCLPSVMPQTPVNVPMSPFGTLFNYAGYMVVGYYLANWPLAKQNTLFKTLFFAIAIAIGIIYGYFLGRSGAKWGYMDGLVTGLSINIVMISLLQYGIVLMLPDRWFAGRGWRVIVWLSTLSLGIYCCHWLVIKYWAMPEGISWPVGTLAALGVSIPLAWLMKSLRGLFRKA